MSQIDLWLIAWATRMKAIAYFPLLAIFLSGQNRFQMFCANE